MGGGASRWRPAVKRIGMPCASFSKERLYSPQPKSIPSSGTSRENEREVEKLVSKEAATAKILCAICLEPLSCDDGSCSQAIFTAQCTHAFHFPCIASNVRHGSVTCPICRAHWSQLPRDSTSLASAGGGGDDPVLRILDDSIASSRVNRLSFVRSTRYDDDDPVELDAATDDGLDRTRLHLAVVPAPARTCPPPPCAHLVPSSLHHRCPLATSPRAAPFASPLRGQRRAAYLSVKLSPQQPTDLVLVASPNGPHLRLLKQSMALVVFWMRPVDRLSIVTYSTTATRAFPLRRMTAQGKRAALLVIDRLFYMGEAEPTEGLRKGVKILEDRRHHNPFACILHLSDHPTRSYMCRDLQFAIPIHRFHIGFGFGMTSGLVMHEFEEFLARLLGGVVREVQLRAGEGGGLVRLGEMRGGEERRIPLELPRDCRFVTVGYSYVEGGAEQRLRTGEVAVETGEKSGTTDDEGDNEAGGSEVSSLRGRGGGCTERWDYLDPLMARRWAKHLHGHKP